MSQPAAVPLTGTWNGTASDGKALRYVFTGETFQFGPVVEGTFASQAQGTYAFDGQTLTLDGTSVDDTGASVRFEVELDAYASATAMCDQAFSAEGRSGVVGTWTSVTTNQPLDANGVATGAAQVSEEIIDLHADGTMDDTKDNVAQSGTYVQTGNAITLTMSSDHTSAVRTFALVDDQVLCDPVYVH